MRRAFIITLCLLVLLSIGGAVFSQRSRKPELTFAEVDSFLKHEAARNGWRYGSHDSMPVRKKPRAGWWDRLGIRRYHRIQQEQYTFGHRSGGMASIVMVWVFCMDGKVTTLQIMPAFPSHLIAAAAPPADHPNAPWIEDLGKIIYRKDPDFAPPAPPSTASP